MLLRGSLSFPRSHAPRGNALLRDAPASRTLRRACTLRQQRMHVDFAAARRHVRDAGASRSSAFPRGAWEQVLLVLFTAPMR